jgi:hypothetical protein
MISNSSSRKGKKMFDDLFEGSKHNRATGHYGSDKSRDKYQRESYNHDGYGHDSYGDGGYGHYNPLLNLAQKVLRNKVLLAVFVFIILAIGAIGVWIIMKMLPYLGDVMSIAEKQGIKGIMEVITPFLQKITEGAGK